MIVFKALLITGFIGALFTSVLYWILGSPGGIRGLTPGRILSGVGLWLVRHYNYVEENPELKKAGINPYKVGICPYCLHFWTSIISFLACALTLFFPYFRGASSIDLVIYFAIHWFIGDLVLFYLKNRWQ